MSIVVRFTPPGLTKEKYDQTIARFEAEGIPLPPEGCDYHVCFGTDGDLLVSEIWDSQEQFEAFGETLMPILEDEGIDAGEPTVIPVHNVIKR